MTGRPAAKRARTKKYDVKEDPRLAWRAPEIKDFNNQITVLVGPKEQRFMLYQDAVCSKSKFFQAACSERWREGQEKTVRLPKLSPPTFQAYSTWIYSGKVVDTTFAQDSNKDMSDKIEQLVNLYLAADVLDDTHLRNVAVFTLFEIMQFHNRLLCDKFLARIWKSTPQGSKIKRMIVDVIVSRYDPADFEETCSGFPSDLMRDIAKAAMAVRPMKTWGQAAKRLPEYLEGNEEN